MKKSLPLLKHVAVAGLFTLALAASGCRERHEKSTRGDEKHLYPSEKAKPAEPSPTTESIPTPGGASGGAAGVQSSTEKKSNPPDREGQPSSR